MNNSARRPKGRTLAVVGFGAALLIGMSACNSDDGSGSKPSKDTTAATTDTPGTINDTEGDQAALPDLVGMNHQAAQDKAQSLGFYDLREKDASGLDRRLLWDRHWTVCDQDPLPGTYPTTTQVTLYSVKIGESCPP